MQGITLIFFPSGVLVCGVCLCSATATRVQVCQSTQRECVCVCASLGLLLYRSPSLSLLLRGTPALSYRIVLHRAHCKQTERGEERETRVKKNNGEGETTGSKDFVRREKAGCKRLRIKKRGLLRERRGVECGGEEIRVEG